MLNSILINQFKKNDGLMTELVRDISESDLHLAQFGSNSILFVLGHVLYSRFYTLNVLGNANKGKLGQFFEYPAKFDTNKKYPSILYIEGELNYCSNLLYLKLLELDDEQIMKTREEKNLLKQESLFLFVTSILRHEVFHLGQVQMMKKNINLNVSKFLF